MESHSEQVPLGESTIDDIAVALRVVEGMFDPVTDICSAARRDSERGISDFSLHYVSGRCSVLHDLRNAFRLAKIRERDAGKKGGV